MADTTNDFVYNIEKESRASISSKPFKIPADFDFNKSTAENYALNIFSHHQDVEMTQEVLESLVQNSDNVGQSENRTQEKEPPRPLFVGKFKEFRKTLDYNYHPHYTIERQIFQDSLINNVISGGLPNNERPWIVFTAGAMGAGKSHVVRWMSQKDFFPLEKICVVDPDEFKRGFPEWDQYVRHDSLTAGRTFAETGGMTHLESGLLVELATAQLLCQSSHIQVDGSLRDWQWHQLIFQKIKQDHPHYGIAILYIFAEPEIVFQRVEKRAKVTGRTVPRESVVKSMEQVPYSVEKLHQFCDFVAYIENTEHPELRNFYDCDHYKDGYPNPPWSVLKEKFPANNPELQAKASAVIEKILDSVDPVLFSKTYCTFCDRTKDILDSLNLRYQVVEIDQIRPHELGIEMQNILKKQSGIHTVPQLYFERNFVGNFERIKLLYNNREILDILPTSRNEDLSMYSFVSETYFSD